MEKFTANLRVILCANSTAKIIGPIRSRCLLLRVGAPTEQQVIPSFLFTISRQQWADSRFENFELRLTMS